MDPSGTKEKQMPFGGYNSYCKNSDSTVWMNKYESQIPLKISPDYAIP
jgi:hypothetical protein